MPYLGYLNRMRVLSYPLVSVALILGLTACSDTQTSNAPKTLSFASIEKHDDWSSQDWYYSRDLRNAPAPYVMWLVANLEEPCRLPVYRTGFPIPFRNLSWKARKKGIEEIEIGVCPNMPDRCYQLSAEWTEVGMPEHTVQKDEACDPELSSERDR